MKPEIPSSIALILLVILVPGISAQDDASCRLNIQIHEAPGLNSYYVFYFHYIELAPDQSTPENRTLTVELPSTGDSPRGVSAYPSLNSSYLELDVGEGEGLRAQITTDSPSVELRYYLPVRAKEVGSHADHLVTFPEPSLDLKLKSLTISVNWPNWNFQIIEILPEGAERVMNPMFETDPYKTVSYYWYHSASQLESRQPSQIQVTMRSAATSQKVTRNQSIMIMALIVVVPTAIFIIYKPPKKLETPKRKFRITDGKPKREIKRGRYKVK